MGQVDWKCDLKDWANIVEEGKADYELEALLDKIMRLTSEFIWKAIEKGKIDSNRAAEILNFSKEEMDRQIEYWKEDPKEREERINKFFDEMQAGFRRKNNVQVGALREEI